MKTTFQDNGHALYHFVDKIYVECPGDSGIGLIRGEANWFLNKARVTSLNGSFYRDWSRAQWFGPVEGRTLQFCHQCGKTLVMERLQRDQFKVDLPRSIQVDCSCGRQSSLAVTWYPAAINTLGRDPFFGLPLFLQEEIRGHLLWFYNLDHLNYIRAYVQAELRERTQVSKWSIITRLPNWVKVGKTRTRILRAMDQMEAQLRAALV